MLETKLLTGSSGYDVVVPSGALTYRLIQAGAIRKRDKSKLGNLGNLDRQIMQLVAANDPGNEDAVPGRAECNPLRVGRVVDMSLMTCDACRSYGRAIPVNEVTACERTLPEG